MAFKIQNSSNESVRRSSEENVNNAVIDVTFMEETLPPPPPPFHMLGAAAELSSDPSVNGVEGFSGGAEGGTLGVQSSLQAQDGGWVPVLQIQGAQFFFNGVQIGEVGVCVSDSVLLVGSHEHDQTHHSQSDGG